MEGPRGGSPLPCSQPCDLGLRVKAGKAPITRVRGISFFQPAVLTRGVPGHPERVHTRLPSVPLITVPARSLGGDGCVRTSFISLSVLIRQPVSGDKRRALCLACDFFFLILPLLFLRSKAEWVLSFSTMVPCVTGTTGKPTWKSLAVSVALDQVEKGEDATKMPKASFPSPPSPESVGSFLLREPQPHRWPPAPAQQPPRVGSLGPFPELKAVTQFFHVRLPHQDRGPGLGAVSARLPPESPGPSMVPGHSLAGSRQGLLSE